MKRRRQYSLEFLRELRAFVVKFTVLICVNLRNLRIKTSKRTPMSDPRTITLAGVDYPIAPLKFRDLKRVLPLFLTLGIDTEDKIAAQGDIVTAAIQTGDPAFTRQAFDDLSPSVPELQAAVSAIAILSGLQPKAGAPGEA
jgi:hypothetical protein